MAETPTPDLGDLLQHPVVQRAVDDCSLELKARRDYRPPACEVFHTAYTVLEETDRYRFTIDKEAEHLLPNLIRNRVQVVRGRADLPVDALRNYTRRRNIGIVFSGGPAPGGHNVIAGLFDAAKRANPDNRLFGFLVGPDGVVENECLEITRERVDAYRNLGGFTMLKTGRAKIDSRKKVDMSRQTCKELGLDALVIVGGDDSNTNAAFLAQEMFDDGIQVIGVPKTIDGDIQVRDDNGHVLCAVSFGFHTAARAFANAIAGLSNDASSDIKYYHVCKVMGRVASHLALEVALQSHPNITVIGEDLVDFVDEDRLGKARRDRTTDYTAFGMTLRHLSRMICDGIVKRAAAGKNYGVIVIPEGVLEFINEVEVFIMKLNTIIAEYNRTRDRDFHSAFPSLEQKLEFLHRLAQRSRDDSSFKLWNTRDEDLFNDLPEFFQEGLLTERDSHGNFQFSQIHTERVLMGLVHDYLNILKEKGLYTLGIQREYVRQDPAQGRAGPGPLRPGHLPELRRGRLPADQDLDHLGQDAAAGVGAGRTAAAAGPAAARGGGHLQEDGAELQDPGALLRLRRPRQRPHPLRLHLHLQPRPDGFQPDRQRSDRPDDRDPQPRARLPEVGAHRHSHRAADAPRGPQGQACARAGEGPGGPGVGGLQRVQRTPGPVARGLPGRRPLPSPRTHPLRRQRRRPADHPRVERPHRTPGRVRGTRSTVRSTAVEGPKLKRRTVRGAPLQFCRGRENPR